MIRTLVVDDEPLTRAGLCALVRGDPDLTIAGECASGSQALQFIAEQSPDIMLLDVAMPEMSGFDVLRALPRSGWPATIIVTAHDTYAIDAFDHDAVDYLLKPFGDTRAREAIQRAKRRVRVRAGAETDWLRFVACRDRGCVSLIPVTDIAWIEAAGDYVRIHTGARRPLIRAQLHELAARLDPAVFLRVHRSCVLNLEHVRELHPLSHGDYEARLVNGQTVKVSRTFRPALAARTGNLF